MIFKRFTVLLVIRLVLVGIAMTAVIWLLLRPGFYSSTLIAGAVLLSLIAELWRFVSKMNREVARFLDAARFGD